MNQYVCWKHAKEAGLVFSVKGSKAAIKKKQPKTRNCPKPKSRKWGGHVAHCYGPMDPRHTGRQLQTLDGLVTVALSRQRAKETQT